MSPGEDQLSTALLSVIFQPATFDYQRVHPIEYTIHHSWAWFSPIQAHSIPVKSSLNSIKSPFNSMISPLNPHIPSSRGPVGPVPRVLCPAPDELCRRSPTSGGLDEPIVYSYYIAIYISIQLYLYIYYLYL
jgi:hypothetical protein